MNNQRKPLKNTARIAVNLLITLIVGILYFYFELPAINLKDPSFYGFLFILAAVYCVLTVISHGLYKVDSGM